MIKDSIEVTIGGKRVDVATYVDPVGRWHRAVLTLFSGLDDEQWAGPSRTSYADAERDAEIMLDAMRQMAGGAGGAS